MRICETVSRISNIWENPNKFGQLNHRQGYGIVALFIV